MRPWGLIFSSFTLATLSSMAWGDVVVLKSGGRVTGTVLKQNDQEVTLQLSNGSAMAIKRSQIASIENTNTPVAPATRTDEQKEKPPSEGILGGAPSGKIHGEDWTAGFAKTECSSLKKENLKVYFYVNEKDASSVWEGHKLSRLTVYLPPLTVGKHKFRSYGGTFTFFTTPGDNQVSDEGYVDVLEVGEKTVKIGIVAMFDEKNYVNGQMEIPLPDGWRKPPEPPPKAAGERGTYAPGEIYEKILSRRLSKEGLLKLLGEPDYKGEYKGQELWQYYDLTTDKSGKLWHQNFLFTDGRVTYDWVVKEKGPPK